MLVHSRSSWRWWSRSSRNSCAQQTARVAEPVESRVSLFILDGDFFHLVALLDGVDDFCVSSMTSPKIECLLSSQGVATCVMKNCEPLEFGPELAIERMPGPLCLRSLWNSSAKVVAGAAGAGAFGAAGLDHEVFDDAVEREAVVEAVVGELLEVGDGLGGFVVVEFEADVAVLGFDGGGFHGWSWSVSVVRCIGCKLLRYNGLRTVDNGRQNYGCILANSATT